MKIAIFANTPAQIHFFKNIMKMLEDDGNNVNLLVRKEGDNINVLDELGIDYFIYSRPNTKLGNPALGKVLSIPGDVLNAYNYLKNKETDIITGFGLYDALTSKMLNIPSILFFDSEPITYSYNFNLLFKLYQRFYDAILTPSSFQQDLGYKHIRINSYKELAYLHPNYYTPNIDTLRLCGLNEGEKFALIRFNALDAVHDLYIKGFRDEDKVRLVKSLEKHIKILISAESKIPPELNKYAIKIPKSKIHDILYYANLFITDTGTMATEAALLGTPSIRCANNEMGVFLDLENQFDLIINLKDPGELTERAIELLQMNSLKENWRIKSKKVFDSKIDITKFMVRFFETYPQSLHMGNK